VKAARSLLRALAPARLVACACVALAVCGAPRMLRAQGVIIAGPSEAKLTTVAPSFSVRAVNFPVSARPLRYTVYVTLNSTGDSPYVDEIPFESTDTIVNIVVRHLLPANKSVYWKARVTLPNGAFYESAIVGPKAVPPWLTLISPNSPNGDQFTTTRRPPFVWKSPRVDPQFGPWVYELQILNNGRAEVATTITGDTVYRPTVELQANTPYTWQIRASVNDGESVTATSVSTFLILDAALPTTTVFYKNFPNPFPSASSFATCFWFDIGAGGAKVKLDIVDLRGNLVQTVVNDQTFTTGAYGRGAEGSGSNCDNRFTWDGRSSTGRIVAAGVYLARFSANGRTPTFVKIKFNGR
jgi:hypothetical protein